MYQFEMTERQTVVTVVALNHAIKTYERYVHLHPNGDAEDAQMLADLKDALNAIKNKETQND